MPIHKLEPSYHERVWGATRLEPWFPNSPVKIGEVWFDGSGLEDAPSNLPLIKFLFTTDKLSVQVHPADEYARLHHQSPGKTEMWHVLAAEPGARIAAGFREPVTRDQVREAATSGEIENLLQWYDAKPGDTFFIPAGTVHAIGAGLTICEIQQRSDITYRLYDYGRPRELHLDRGLEVARLSPSEVRATLPVACPYFVTSHVGSPSDFYRDQLLVVTEGAGSAAGVSFRQGDVLFVARETDEVFESKGHVQLLSIRVPPDGHRR